MEKTQIKLIIFDGYGALLSRGYPDTVKVLAKKFKLPPSKLQAVFYTKYFNQAALRKITQKQAWELAVRELKLPIKWQKVRDLHLALFSVNQPVLKIAQNLRKNYTTLMLSKNTRSQFSDTKKRFPRVWASFDAVINTWELKLPKASKETVLEICRRFKVKPQEIILIDDQANNLVAAKKMGVKTIFYKDFKQFKNELDKYLL
jgi:putative hydrolase of the HAD superfamily